MGEVHKQPLTAGDLMSRGVETVRTDTPLREVAQQFARLEVHGAPVVDGEGRCVGVLSVSDLARWALRHDEYRVRPPRACSFQVKSREPGGREAVLCQLPMGVCSFQHCREMSDGKSGIVCGEPHSVSTDWQVVEFESLPGDLVRDFMTTAVVTAELGTPVRELARLMLDHRISRLVITEPQGRPVGMVTVNDLLQVLAHPEITSDGGRE